MERRAQFLELGEINTRLKSFKTESSAQDEAVDDNCGEGGSGQVCYIPEFGTLILIFLFDLRL